MLPLSDHLPRGGTTIGARHFYLISNQDSPPDVSTGQSDVDSALVRLSFQMMLTRMKAFPAVSRTLPVLAGGLLRGLLTPSGCGGWFLCCPLVTSSIAHTPFLRSGPQQEGSQAQGS